MASRADKQAISAISMAAGVQMRLEAHYKDLPGRKEIKRLLQGLDETCHHGLSVYDGSLKKKEIEALRVKLELVEQACFEGENQEQCPVVMLSLVLGALSDVWDRTTNPKRREALDWILEACGKTLRYYDRNLTRQDAYDTASRGLVVWDREMAA